MIIISWDVGIINLAFCIIEKKDDETNILNWGTINLLNQNNYKCHGFIDSNNKNSTCEKDCKFYFQDGEKKYYFCGLHKKQFSKIERKCLIIDKYKGDVSCQEVTSKGEICNKKSSASIDNKIFCSYHANKVKKNYENNDLKKIIIPNASKAPIEVIKKNLIDHLDNNKSFLDVDYVLIENQPSMKNPKMKSVAETLYSWFLIRGLIDKYSYRLKNILYLSPGNKIKIKNDDVDKEVKKIKDESKKYKFTKNIGIIYTRDILKNRPEMLKLLDESKKKDDLCDSFLQGLYFYDNINKFV